MNFNSMIGKVYLFNGAEHRIRLIKPVGKSGDYEVRTNLSTLKVTLKELRRDFLPIDGEGPSASTAIVKVMRDEIRPMHNLSTILLDNITKIQKDKNYIPQAKAINEQAKTLIGLAKFKLDVLKTGKR